MNMFSNLSFDASFGLPVPHEKFISPSLTNGTQIHIVGTPTGNRFEINLKNWQDDIVLHLNPRLDDSSLVLNSAQRGSWGQEERHALPFQRGVRFAMVILATDRGFQISVNNARVCEFHLRAPMHLAQSVQVKGDIKLESVQVHPGGMHFPQMGANISVFSSALSSLAGAINQGITTLANQPMMHAGGVPSIQSCRIQTGSRIFVRGFLPPGANRFELNFLQGHSDSSDIAFHFNPRFDVRTIVKNHRQQGQWGNEENQPFPSHMPLMPGSPIDLQITCDPYKYLVYMNHVPIAEFYHKLPPGAVMALQYKGDIQVTSIGQM